MSEGKESTLYISGCSFGGYPVTDIYLTKKIINNT
jgi:hypothetical protein